MQNSTTTIGCHRGTCNKKGHKAGGVRKGAGRKKRMQSVESQNLGSFSMNQILSALQKHMSNLALHIFQMYFKSNVILMDRFMTPELQKNNQAFQAFTLLNYMWPHWEEREQISMNIWQLLKEQIFCCAHGYNTRISTYLIPPWWLVLICPRSWFWGYGCLVVRKCW